MFPVFLAMKNSSRNPLDWHVGAFSNINYFVEEFACMFRLATDRPADMLHSTSIIHGG